jgi:hypothetical protein
MKNENSAVIAEQAEIGKQVTLQKNEFTFKMVGLSDFKFEIHEHYITPKQPFNGITKTQCNQEGCTITVVAGRSQSKEVANWFKLKIGQGSAIGCASFDRLPDKLNFAFIGTMSFSHKGRTYTGHDIVLAQGHNARSRNNWWIGGSNMSTITNVPVPHLAAIAQNFTYAGFLIAKVDFVTLLEQVSHLDMGLIDIL